MRSLNKKAGTPLVIMIFVVLTAALLVYTLDKFSDKEEIKDIQIESTQVLEGIYAKEALINSYISDLVKKSASETSSADEEIFLDNFEKNFNEFQLRTIIPETRDVPLQLDTSNVEIENNEVLLTLKFKIDSTAYSEDREIVSAEYIYEKTFSGELGSEEIEETQDN